MKVFYHHIPRTGGTTISKIAEKTYGKNIFFVTQYDDINWLLNYVENKNDLFLFCDSLMIDSTKIKRIINLCDIDFISVRNPISRFESLYNIWKDANQNNAPYMIGDKNLSIDDFYLKCKEENKQFLLNLQHKYLNLYNPKEKVVIENFSESINRLKSIGIFNQIDEDDLIPKNQSKNNYRLSENLIVDYKTSYPEDFQIFYAG